MLLSDFVLFGVIALHLDAVWIIIVDAVKFLEGITIPFKDDF